MSEDFSHSGANFDKYAADYDAALSRGISVSGEDKSYFARGRINWTARVLKEIGAHPKTIMDLGCGTGSATQFFFDLLEVDYLVGVDVSAESLSVARRTNGTEQTRFMLFTEYRPREEVDLVFCNGVFHHIPPRERAAAVDYVYRSLRPGGLFAFWENNPWNPGTRYVMRRIPFDRDAKPISPLEAKRLLRTAGLEILQTHFLFIFPGVLRWLRFLEAPLARLPLGAQYQVLCRKR